MELNLSNKVVIVTGSSKGIGLSIARYLSNEGCKVVINGRDIKKLKKAQLLIPNCLAISADVSVPSEAKRLINETIKAYGHINHIICNAGSGKSVSPGNETYKEWQNVFATNFWTATNMVESAKSFLASTKGSIVCISSICGIEYIPDAPITYSVSKSALNAYVKSISRPLGKRNIRINAIAPGNILFEGSVWDRKIQENLGNVEKILERDVALNKLGSTEDICNLTGYLLSSHANFVTGAVWTIDGGQIRG